MFIKQLSVILENKKGALADWAGLMADNNVDLIACAIVDTGETGTLRAVVNDPDTALELLRKAHYAATVTDVLAVVLLDRLGSLAEILALLRTHDICVEYFYPFMRQFEGDGVVVFRVNLPGAARALFEAHAIPMLSEEQLATKTLKQ
ncbi:MAG: amino acid-binding protein [Candidatus Fimivivens sp.]